MTASKPSVLQAAQIWYGRDPPIAVIASSQSPGLSRWKATFGGAALVRLLTHSGPRSKGGCGHTSGNASADPPYGLPYCAAAGIGTCAFNKLRTRLIVRCLSSSGSFHGNTVISAFGASEGTSIEVCRGCPGTSSGQHQHWRAAVPDEVARHERRAAIGQTPLDVGRRPSSAVYSRPPHEQRSSHRSCGRQLATNPTRITVTSAGRTPSAAA
jgi:hypothetical protein